MPDSVRRPSVKTGGFFFPGSQEVIGKGSAFGSKSQRDTDNRRPEMRFEIENGDYVGSAEWRGPGDVLLDMDDPQQRMWFERFFAEEDASLGGAIGDESMSSERRSDSEQSFNRAAFQLAAYSYKVRQGDDRRHSAHRNGKTPHK
jgi:hypothetical protein